MLELRKKWSLYNAPYALEVLSISSYSKEFQESLSKDKMLLPLVFGTMCIFSSLVYYRRDKVRSSSIFLGLGAVITVLFSLLTSFGIMFTIGVPFTNLTFMLPFVIMGIGLDGKF